MKTNQEYFQQLLDRYDGEIAACEESYENYIDLASDALVQANRAKSLKAELLDLMPSRWAHELAEAAA